MNIDLQISFVKEANPARKTLEVGKTASGSKTANVEILIIDPDCCFCIIGCYQS